MARRFADFGKVAILVLFCLSLSLSILITDKTFTASHLTEEAVTPTMQYFSFIFGLAPLPSVFKDDEASHMRDVAWLLRAAVLIAGVSGVVFVAVTKRGDWHALAVRTLIFFACTGIIAALIPFDALFRVFHLIFFPQGNWVFPVNSVLISFYPQSFFAWYALCWFGYSMFTAGIIMLFSRAFVE